MARNRKTAKQAGTRFERLIADHLRDNLDDRIDRRVKTGANDKGDIAGVRDSHGRRIVIETKDYGGRLLPAQWVKEAHNEADNETTSTGAEAIGIVIAKRRGTTNPAEQWALMTVNDLTQLLTPGEPQ